MSVKPMVTKIIDDYCYVWIQRIFVRVHTPVSYSCVLQVDYQGRFQQRPFKPVLELGHG